MFVVLLGVLAARAQEEVVLLTGAGASLPAALYSELFFAYQIREDDVMVNYEAVGSGGGIRAIKGGTVDFAGSDAVLTDADYAEVPDLQMYPSAAAAVVPITSRHLGTDLVLGREVLADIFRGNVTCWNNAALLGGRGEGGPCAPITLVVRSDGSGTTEIFVKALRSFSAAFDDATKNENPELPRWRSWLPAEVRVIEADGNSGVVAAVVVEDGAIGYAAVSAAEAGGAQVARMRNKAGAVVEASALSVSYAVAEKAGPTLLENPRLTADLVDPNSETAWPISGLTYFIIRNDSHCDAIRADGVQLYDGGGDPNDDASRCCEARAELVTALEWYYTSTTVARTQERLKFARLPEVTRTAVLDVAIERIRCPDGAPAYRGAATIAILPLAAPSIAATVLAPINAAYAEEQPKVVVDTEASDDVTHLWHEFAAARSKDVVVTSFYGPAELTSYSDALREGTLTFAAAPLFVAGVVAIYNVPGVVSSEGGLTFSPSLLAAMFRRDITMWNDTRLVAANPALEDADLPILPVYVRGESLTTLALSRAFARATNDGSLLPGIENNEDSNTTLRAVSSDAEAVATVSYLEGALGYALYTADLGYDVGIARSTGYFDDDAAPLAVPEALDACHDAVVELSDLVATLDLASAYHDPLSACWPMSLAFDVAVAVSSGDFCSPISDEDLVPLEYARWLYEPDLLAGPLRDVGLSPVAEAARRRFYDRVGGAICGGGSSERSGQSILSREEAFVGIVAVAFVALLVGLAACVQRRKAQAARAKVRALERKLAEVKDAVVALRVVVTDYVPVVTSTLWKEGQRSLEIVPPFLDNTKFRYSHSEGVDQQPTTTTKEKLTTVRWYHQKKNNDDAVTNEDQRPSDSWAPFSEDVSRQIETAYQKYLFEFETTGQTTVASKDFPFFDGEEEAIVDFLKMQQRSSSSSEKNTTKTGGVVVRGVRRRTKSRGGHLDDDDDEAQQPFFPRDIAYEPRLVLRRGALVQITRTRRDEWAFGSVVLEPDEDRDSFDDDDDDDDEIPLGEDDQQQRVSDDDTDDFDIEQLLERASLESTKCGGFSPYAVPQPSHVVDGRPDSASPMPQQPDLYASRQSGWFPLRYTSEPSSTDIRRLAESVGGAAGALQMLEPPSHWTEAADPLIAERVELDESSDERRQVVEAFLSTLDQKRVHVLRVDRIQNCALWQCYVVKRETIFTREATVDIRGGCVSPVPGASPPGSPASSPATSPKSAASSPPRSPLKVVAAASSSSPGGKLAVSSPPRTYRSFSSSSTSSRSWPSPTSKTSTKQKALKDDLERRLMDRYERFPLFHGTQEHVIPKIIQQGFNRSFCGKNATLYGRGTYFARDASYSVSKAYSRPSQEGLQYIFACRVLVGEYCRGRNDMVAPDERDAESHLLFDSTVDSLHHPSIFVTYHDAQAYPEYLIVFAEDFSNE